MALRRKQLFSIRFSDKGPIFLGLPIQNEACARFGEHAEALGSPMPAQ